MIHVQEHQSYELLESCILLNFVILYLQVKYYSYKSIQLPENL